MNMQPTTEIDRDLAALARMLRSDVRVGRVDVYPVVDSTNRRALELADAGAPHMSIVVADRQTAGRGRRGRTWVTGPGEGLLLSAIVRPGEERVAWGWLPLVAGVAVARTAREVLTGPEAAVSVKWPNDVRVAGGKVAGTLVERRMSGPHGSDAAVVGVGLNVNQPRFDEDLAGVATSLRIHAGRMLDRADVGRKLVGALADVVDAWRRGRGFDAYRALLEGIGEEVTVRSFDGGDVIEGTLRGVDADGCLVVATRDGVRTFAAADVTMRGR